MTNTFELTEDELAIIAPSGGRKSKPSIYLDDVKAAIGVDKAFGIAVPAGEKGGKIVSQLHKAGKELGVKLKVWNRDTATPKPFVGFKVVGPVEVPTDTEDNTTTPA